MTEDPIKVTVPERMNILNTSENLKMFGGAALLIALFGIASYWIEEFRMVAATQFGALIGAAAMKMSSDKPQ